MTEDLSKLAHRISCLQIEWQQRLGRQLAAASRFEQAKATALLPWLLASNLRNVVSAPFIYGMVIPLAALDVCLMLYQLICFPLYGIPRVKRADYLVLDRHRLGYLNSIEKLHCVYCGYINGLVGYLREIAARTEQYWCPIKHNSHVPGSHHLYANFLDYGDGSDYQERLVALRQALQRGEDHADDEAPSTTAAQPPP